MDATRLIARLLWLVPAIFLFLTWNQAHVAHDLRQTWEQGVPATAEVLAYDNSNRVDVTYGYVSLRVPLPDGRVIEKDQMSLPTTLLPRLEGESELAVHVLPGTAQELVVDKLMPAHWLIAAGQAGMSFLGFLLFGGGVLWWNRYLHREEKLVEGK